MEHALLAAICAQPEDTSARLVYADYLLEQSEPEKRDRGEFILAQCRLAAGRLPPADEANLRRRERELLDKYRTAWAAPVAAVTTNCSFHRGFPERVSMTPEQFAAAFRDVAAAVPVARVHVILRIQTPSLFGRRPPPGIAGLPELQGVIGLDLSREYVTPDDIRELLASPHLSRLTYLNLSDNVLDDASVEALAESPVLPQLTHLSLARNRITSAGVSRLLSRLTGGRGFALRWLNLRRNSLVKGNWADTVLGWLPPKTPAALRLSLEGQLGRYRLAKPEPDGGPLRRLKKAKLPPDFAAWVKALDVSQPAQLVAVLRGNPLPAKVQRAFVAMCRRRLEWAFRRFDPKNAAPQLPAATDPTGLGDLVQVVLHAVRQPTTAHAMWLRDWLLRFLEQYAAGTLDAEGRTR